jgi:cytochrome bd-type quinol oxidase subunit 2
MEASVSEAHQLGAVAVLALTVGLLLAAVWSALDARRFGGARDHRFAVDRLVLAVIAAIGVTLVLGATLLATGRRPADGLHLLYAVLALITVPAGWWIGGRPRNGGAPERIRRDASVAIAAVILLGIEFRLLATG